MRNKYFTTTQIIAKEGWNQSVIAFMLFLLSYALSFVPYVFFFLFVLILWSYRNPERIAEEDDAHCIVAPMDGKIRAISKVNLEDGSEALLLVIRKSFFDVGVIRSPIAMQMDSYKNRFGLLLSSASPLFPHLSERKSFTCSSALASFRFVISAGSLSGKVVLFQKEGFFRATQRIGFVRDGEVALLLPLDCRLKVSINERVYSGMSILGYLAYKEQNVK